MLGLFNEIEISFEFKKVLKRLNLLLHLRFNNCEALAQCDDVVIAGAQWIKLGIVRVNVLNA